MKSTYIITPNHPSNKYGLLKAVPTLSSGVICCVLTSFNFEFYKARLPIKSGINSPKNIWLTLGTVILFGTLPSVTVF